MLSKQDIEKVNEATDIVSLVSEYISLEKSGKNFKGICPFHDDSSPSFYVSDEKKIAKCMVCGEGGRPIKFLMKIKKISFYQALSELSQKANLNLDIKVYDKPQNDYSNYYNIMQKALELFKRSLKSTQSGQMALNYLHKRNIDDEIIKNFEIGLSSSKADVLYNVLKDNNILELDMLDLGLVNKYGDKFIDVFTKRIMFTIRDEDNNIVAFSGRTYLKDVKDSEAKYVNSRETKIFIKGNILYNLNNALVDIRRKNQVVLYEGFLDVIASYKAGIKEAVCSMGTALTINQAKLIKKHTDNVIICYDSDKAGITASFKAIEVLEQVNLNVKLVLLPDNLDPDDYINEHSKEDYVKFFSENIIDPLEYKYKIIIQELNTKDISMVNDTKIKLFKLLNKTKSFLIIESYLKKFASLLDISYESLKSDYDLYFNKYPISKGVEKENALNDLYNNDEYFNTLEENIRYNGILSQNEPVIPDEYISTISDDYIPSYEEVNLSEVDFSFLDENKPNKNSRNSFSSIKAKENAIKYILSNHTKSILRLINYAKESKKKALSIDAKLAITGISSVYRKIWMTLIDEYYQKHDHFDQQIFFHILDENEQNIYADDTIETEKRLNDPYSDNDLEYCIDTISICALENKAQDLALEIKSIKISEQKEEPFILKIQTLKQRDKMLLELKQKYLNKVIRK